MNKQRFAVIIVALIGLIATFLPWYKIVQLGTISGMSSSGWFTFIMFIIVIILALRKDLHEDLSMGISWSITICSLLASFVVLWKIIDVWFAQPWWRYGGNIGKSGQYRLRSLDCYYRRDLCPVCRLFVPQ